MQVREWERRLEESGENFARVSRVVRREIGLFERYRVRDFRCAVVQYLEALLACQAQMVGHWEEFLPEVKAILFWIDRWKRRNQVKEQGIHHYPFPFPTAYPRKPVCVCAISQMKNINPIKVLMAIKNMPVILNSFFGTISTSNVCGGASHWLWRRRRRRKRSTHV